MGGWLVRAWTSTRREFEHVSLSKYDELVLSAEGGAGGGRGCWQIRTKTDACVNAYIYIYEHIDRTMFSKSFPKVQTVTFPDRLTFVSLRM